VVRPLGRLAIAAGDIAGGTYDLDIPVRGWGFDEIGVLGTSFCTMASEVRKRTEALLESRSSLAAAQHIGRIGSWDRDMVNNTLNWSDETYRIFGFTPQRFGGTYDAFIDTVHPEDRALVEQSMGKALCRGKPYDIDHRIRTPDGVEKVVHEKGTVHFDSEGAPVRVVGTVQDITERVLAVKAIVESEKKYRTLFEESKDAIIISSPEGKLLNINPVGIELFGYSSSEELLDVNIAEYLCANPADRTRFSRALEENGSVNDFEVVGKKRGGQPVVLSITASAVSGHDGKAVAYRGIVRDITEHKKLQQQLIQAQKMEAVGQLTGGIAHDFNNILTTIIGYGKLALRKIGKDDPVRTYIEEMLFSSDRAAALTQGLLAFSRKQVMDIKPVNIIGVVNNFEKLLSMVIGENIEIKTSSRKRNLMVMADSAQVEQVLMNLATNARDAMSGEGTLSIITDAVEIDAGFIRTHGYGEPGNYACIVVADTGAGMDEETRKRIFEPFFTTKGVGEGTGLGLSIIYGIIKQHNGYINVESAPGAGATFRIYLPVTAQVEKTPDPAAALAPLAGRETVLLAEDDAEVRKLTKTVLEEFGYTVIAASNGGDAVSRFEENSEEVRLIILDMIMPGKTGKEAYDEIIKIKPGIKVLFTSGYTQYVVDNRGFFEDGLDIIMKPNTPAELLRKIREILDR
jgi:PAS domain S-box-containing protein